MPLPLTTGADAMTKAAASRARVSAGALVFVVATLAGVSGSCADSRVSLGESCLKDEDCLSGICAEQRCVAAPPLLDGAASETDASGEVPEDAATDSAPTGDSAFDVAADERGANVVGEAGADTGAALDADAAADAVTEAPVDALADGRTDASIAVQLDSSTDGAEGG
jgi:hypothetical protein